MAAGEVRETETPFHRLLWLFFTNKIILYIAVGAYIVNTWIHSAWGLYRDIVFYGISTIGNTLVL